MRFLKMVAGISLLVGICNGAADAQPDETRRRFVAPPPNKVVMTADSQLIEKVVRGFVGALNSGYARSDMIYGARRGFFGAHLLLHDFAESNRFELKIQSVSAPKIDGESATSAVIYRLEAKKNNKGETRISDAMRPLMERECKETLQFKTTGQILRYQPINGVQVVEKEWRIVPPDIEPSKPPIGNVEPPSLAYFAFIMAQKPVNEKNLSPETSLSNLKELGFAVMQFAQDYDDQIVFAPEYMQDALMPYLKNRSLFYVPGSLEAYAFNTNLSEKLIDGLPEGAVHIEPNSPFLKSTGKTVMFYEGRDEKPTFRYNGKAAICFADGHVSLVSPEEAKALIWKP